MPKKMAFTCPSQERGKVCGGRMILNGVRWSGKTKRQRYQCTECGYSTCFPVAVPVPKAERSRRKQKCQSE